MRVHISIIYLIETTKKHEYTHNISIIYSISIDIKCIIFIMYNIDRIDVTNIRFIVLSLYQPYEELSVILSVLRYNIIIIYIYDNIYIRSKLKTRYTIWYIIITRYMEQNCSFLCRYNNQMLLLLLLYS